MKVKTDEIAGPIPFVPGWVESSGWLRVPLRFWQLPLGRSFAARFVDETSFDGYAARPCWRRQDGCGDMRRALVRILGSGLIAGLLIAGGTSAANANSSFEIVGTSIGIDGAH